MAADLIHDRGRGPEIVGTRITVYNLLPDFLDPSRKQEVNISRIFQLTPGNRLLPPELSCSTMPTPFSPQHLESEARMSAGNPPQLVEKMQQTHATFLRFKEWLANRKKTCAHDETWASPLGARVNGSGEFPKFKEWLAEQESRPREKS